jgi:hypothetical protein
MGGAFHRSAGREPIQAKSRALVEQAMAALKPWRLLRKPRCSTTRITGLVQAVLTLQHASSTTGWKSLIYPFGFDTVTVTGGSENLGRCIVSMRRCDERVLDGAKPPFCGVSPAVVQNFLVNTLGHATPVARAKRASLG